MQSSCTAYAQGRKIHEQAVSPDSDPWLAIFAPGNLTTGVLNMILDGKPVIPETVTLSGASDLTGWLGDYYGEPTQGEAAYWQKRGEEIVGRKLRTEATFTQNENMNGGNQSTPPEAVPGSKVETILRYARPLAEDGELSYEFFHEDGPAEVHPAIGRIALCLDPKGVKIHRITDGKFERTGVDPANAIDVPADRRGPATLPFKSKAWNRVSLRLKGDKLAIMLNGEFVYETTLEPTNQREFGLFRFAEETEARVRNVTYRGDWPRSLPPEILARPSTALAR